MPKGTRASRERKRQIVARGKVAGKKSRVIANEAGCSVRHVEKLAHDPATHILIAELMRPHRVQLEEIVEKCLLVVGDALGAKRLRGTPDHEIRLRAVGRAAELLQLAQGDKPPDESTAGLVTWEEFVVMYRRRAGHAAENR